MTSQLQGRSIRRCSMRSLTPCTSLLLERLRRPGSHGAARGRQRLSCHALARRDTGATGAADVSATPDVSATAKRAADASSASSSLPEVDWTRYHLQVLFVDRTDTVRARVACALFERISEWNGFGRALYPWTCGVEADKDPFAALSTRAGLMRQARRLGVPAKAFARAGEAFDAADLDHYDVVVALDSSVKQAILAKADPAYTSYYDDKVRLLSEFGAYGADDDALLARGGFALLPAKMANALRPVLPTLRQAGAQSDVSRPNLTQALSGEDGEQAVEAWNVMVMQVVLGAAGLCNYLMKAMPDNLPASWLE